jgi:hypothetical protein
MKSHRATVTLHLPERTGFANITPDVEEARDLFATGGVAMIAHVLEKKNMPLFYQKRSPVQGRTSSLSSRLATRRSPYSPMILIRTRLSRRPSNSP